MKTDIFNELKSALESDLFTDCLLQRGDIDSENRRKFIVKCLHYLIGTRDFEGFPTFLSYYFKGTFPQDYLKREKGLCCEKAEQTVYNNFIKNGFLFHVTPDYNLGAILDKGLQSLNDRLECDIYKKTLELNDIYRRVKRKNMNKKDLFKGDVLIKVPGLNTYDESRFTNVFLSSNLDYVLETYGYSGELSYRFVYDLFRSFNRLSELSNFSKQELKEKIVEIIYESEIVIEEKELEYLLEFVDLVYSKQISSARNMAILMVPVDKVITNDYYFKYYQSELPRIAVENIIELKKGEIENGGSIDPENIWAITTNDDKSLKLVRKEGLKL